MSKTLILTETQVKKLMGVIINEQQSNQVVFSVDFQNAFPSGQYNFTPEYEKIVNDNVDKIGQFITGKNIKNFKLQISSGESQVTNPKGFEEKGSLARKRAEVLKGYLDIVIPKELGMSPVIEVTQPIIGKTPYVLGQSKTDPRYSQEQFVKVNVVVVSEEPIKPKENPDKGFVINVRGDEPNMRGAYYFPKNLEDWKKITEDKRLTGFFSNSEQRGTGYAGTTVNMNHDVFLKYWLSKAPDLESALGPAYVRNPKNPNNFILKP